MAATKIVPAVATEEKRRVSAPGLENDRLFAAGKHLAQAFDQRP